MANAAATLTGEAANLQNVLKDLHREEGDSAA